MLNAYPNPLLISRGPALVTYQGASFFTKGDLKLDFGVTMKAVERSGFGPGQMYATKIAPVLTVPLVGAVENLGILFPYGAMLVGSSIFSASALIIQPLDTTQKQITFYDAAVFKEPSLTLGSDQLSLGDVTFRFRPQVGQPLTSNTAWFVEGENEWDGEGYEASTIIAQAYLSSWLSQGTFTLTLGADTTASVAYDVSATDLQAALNTALGADTVTVTGTYQSGYTVTFVATGVQADNFAGAVADMPLGSGITQQILTAGAVGVAQIVLLQITPWAEFPTEEAIKVEFEPKITEAPSSQIGFYDLIFGGTSAKATLLPLNINETTLLAAANIQGSASGLGTAPSAANSANLSIFAPGLFVMLYNSTLKPASALWSAAKQRMTAWQFDTGSNIAAGVDTKYYVGTSAPE
jgi:hypothetical protein